MHKLLDSFRYQTHSVFSKLGEVTCNKIVKYDYECNLKLKNFLNFYTIRVLTAVEKMENKEIRFLNNILGLPQNTEVDKSCNVLTAYISEMIIFNIISLTRFRNDSKLKESIGTASLKLPAIVTDLVRAINCNSRLRQIMGSESVLYCEKLKINHDLPDDKIENLDKIMFYNLKLNKLIELLKLDKLVDIDDFESLYHSNDYDFSFYVEGEEPNLNIVVGQNNNDDETIAALLLRNKITNTENYYPKTRKYTISLNDAIDIVKTGEPAHSEAFGLEAIKSQIITVRLNSKLNRFSNKVVTMEKIEGGQEIVDSVKNRPEITINDEKPPFKGFSKKGKNKDGKTKED